MRLISLTLRSRPVFIFLYCVFLFFLAATVVDALSNSVRISIPNLIRGVAAPLVIGSIFLSYWFYMTHMVDINFSGFWGMPRFSAKLFLYLVFSCALLAILVVLVGIFFNTAAGMMTALIYTVGLIGVAVLATIRPHFGICALIITMPIAFLLRLNLGADGVFFTYKVVVINPETLLLLVVAIMILTGIMARGGGLVRTKLDLPIFAFVLGSFIALLYSPEFALSAKVLFVGTGTPILAYYIIVNGVKTKQEMILVGLTLVFSLFLMGLYSLLAFQREIPISALLSGQDRLTGFFTNIGLFALILTLVLPLTLSLAASTAISLKLRFLASLIFVVLVTTLIFTFTRGAWASFLVSVIVIVILSRDVRNLLLKNAPLLLLAFLLWGGVFSQIFWARTVSINNLAESSSWTERVATLEAGWRMANDNYLVGVGPGLFRVFFGDYETGSLANLESFQGTDSHNLLLTVWAETGTLAVTALASIFIIALWRAYQAYRKIKDPLLKTIALGLLGGIIGFLVNSFTHGAELTNYTVGQNHFTGAPIIYLFIFLGLIFAVDRIGANEQS